MAYAIKVAKMSDDGRRARYLWESTTGRSGNVLLDADARLFRPCDELGSPIGDMSVRAGADVENADPETVQDFVTVVGGILKKWKGSGAPPETAHRYFG